MVGAEHRKSAIAFFITLGVGVVALAVALNVGWILISWQTGILLFFGVLFFLLIITGVVLNTIFLVREIRRNEQHDAFINSVTHELKTPVASIRLYLQTLETRDIDETRRREFYKIMVDDTDRLMSTIEQVLRAGRTASRRRLAHRSPLDLRAIARECVDVACIRQHISDTAVRYVETMPGQDATVLGDADELKAAIANLIDNAIKYSGANVDVAVELVRQDDRLAVRVKDRGIGIPAAELKRIWKRFYRIPGVVAARVKGTGLGLFIVRSVAERHGGRAFAESEGTGCGSTFTIQLPLAHRR